MKANFKNLNSHEFLNEMTSNGTAILLDVRTPAEYKSGKLPGALNVDIMDDGFEKAIAQLDKNKTYYVYCRSGGRSRHACHVMAQQGYSVANLADGIASWHGEIV